MDELLLLLLLLKHILLLVLLLLLLKHILLLVLLLLLLKHILLLVLLLLLLKHILLLVLLLLRLCDHSLSSNQTMLHHLHVLLRKTHDHRAASRHTIELHGDAACIRLHVQLGAGLRYVTDGSVHRMRSMRLLHHRRGLQLHLLLQ